MTPETTPSEPLQGHLAKGMVGVISPLAGTMVSILPDVEEFLRIISLLIGIAVGVVTLVLLLRSWRRGETPNIDIGDDGRP